MSDIAKAIPVENGKVDLAAIKNYIERTGLRAEGRREDLASLQKGPFPAIAHYGDEEHFVVVTSVDKRYVHLLDCFGSRESVSVAEFARRWSGAALHVAKPHEERAAAVASGSQSPGVTLPKIVFKSCFIDKGTMTFGDEYTRFLFEFSRAPFITVIGKRVAYQFERKEFRSCHVHGRLIWTGIRISRTHNGIASNI